MRIAHLINSLSFGGAEQIVASLALYHRLQGHVVKVICLREIGSNPIDTTRLLEVGVDIFELKKPAGLHIGTLKILKLYLQKHQIEILHTHNHIVHHYGVFAGRWCQIPVILNTLHGTSSFKSSGTWSQLLFWVSCVLSDQLVCVDEQVRNIFDGKYIFLGNKLVVIANGADLSRFLSPAATKLTRQVFGTMGRLDPIKGHDILLRAFALLKNENPKLQLRILGDGPLKNKLLNLAQELSISDCVSFEGFSLNTPVFLEKIDIYVISSLSEGLPISLLEAMAAGLPIVSTAVGGIPKILKMTTSNWLCEPNNIISLKNAMNLAVSCNDLAVISQKNRAIACNNFSIKRMADDYEELYKRLLN